ncbi:hypothetical protein BN77_1191 [Rhizobium mesoamericanum STM3625]|uniref:Uncharacterized protein n=1 Tax=Rhizobium mesoamericanum STM3625 TaxID=1211777 RepID=K0PRU4_9HYPH|nr:hypothetical protein BN77_1191 [Rhizobium mesoamericanum STM3625]
MGDKAAASDRHKALRGGHISEYLVAIYLMPKGEAIALALPHEAGRDRHHCTQAQSGDFLGRESAP